MKTLGVIGGMGPKASCVFYDRVIEHTVAEKDQDHINMVILSYGDFIDRTESIKSGDDEELKAQLARAAKQLEYLGAENIVITCNTSHYFADAIESATDVPLINMIEETVRECESRGDKVIGIMGTEGTVKSGIYSKCCERKGLTPVVPSEDIQTKVTSLIYDDIKAGKVGDPEKFKKALEYYKSKGCDRVILACTELSVYCEENGLPEYCIDALDILVREAIVRSGAQYK